MPTHGRSRVVQELFDAALNLTFAQDDHFGHPRRRTLSQRDVPGLTRNAIPLLARRGVAAVSVGENSQIAPSAVPPIFLWQDNATGTEVIALFHALGYGGSFPSSSNGVEHGLDTDDGPPSIRVIRSPDGTQQQPTVLGAGSRDEACVSVHAAGVALCYAWKVDNSGPHTDADSDLIFRTVADLFPNAEIAASDSFDAFVEAVLPHKSTLPVVTAELGDTWIMGADADPKKIALFRAASRLHAACARGGSCVQQAGGDAAVLRDFERLLMVAGEHTWGWNGGTIRSRSWRNEQLSANLVHDREFRSAVKGWVEVCSLAMIRHLLDCFSVSAHSAFCGCFQQRSILRNALATLPPSSTLATAITSAWKDIETPAALPFDDSGLKDVPIPQHAPLQCGEFKIGFGSDGSIVHLHNGQQLVQGPPLRRQPLFHWSQLPFRLGCRFVSGAVSSQVPFHRRSGVVRLVQANPAHPLGRLFYQGMDIGYFKRYVNQYVAGVSEIDPKLTAALALYKPGMKEPAISSAATLLRLRSDGHSAIILDMRFAVAAAHSDRGAPASMQARLKCGGPNEPGTIEYDLRWHNKTATHIPETLWLSNVPIQLADLEGQRSDGKGVASARGRVGLDKLGAVIDPLDVDLSGGVSRVVSIHVVPAKYYCADTAGARTLCCSERL